MAKKKKINSKQKGKVGELEFAHFLTDSGFLARRGQQFKGSPDSPDIICNQLADYHFEVKRTESLSLYKAMEQAKEDSGIFQIPVIAHRRNNKEWLIVLHAKDFLRIMKKKT